MSAEGALAKITVQTHRMIHRLNQTETDPSNSDRALLGALAIAHFASVTGRAQAVLDDPETVIADLLADLMHWCDVQKSHRQKESIEFGSAWERAREYYEEELSGDSEQGGAIRK
jgi:hypothetical protein